MARMLTTSDNPYNPFTHWDEWYQYDEGHGYHTCAYLDRVSYTSSELSEADQQQAIDDAIDEIVAFDLTNVDNVHYIVVDDSSDNEETD